MRVIYDLGSRDALDGLYLLKAIPAEELHVFECNPSGVELCRENVASYRDDGSVTVNELAVSDRDAWVPFYAIDPARTVTSWPDGNIGASSLFRANPRYPSESYHQREIQVRSVRLDTYIANARQPDMLWVDLQGAELAAFKGAQRVLAKVRLIHVEVSFRPVYLGQPLFHEVDGFLKSNGFSLFSVTNIGIFRRLLPAFRRLPIGSWFGDAVYVRS